MFSIQELNIIIEVWSAAFCFIGIACTILFSRAEGSYRNLVIAGFAAGMFAAGGDALAGIYRGVGGQGAWIATHVGNLLTFWGGFLLLGVFTWYLCARLKEAGGVPLAGWKTVVSVGVVVMCICTACGVFYYIDDANIYHRSDFFGWSSVFTFIVGVVNTLHAVRYRRELGFLAFACLLSYSLAPIIVAIIQLLSYGLNVGNAIGAIGLLLLFFEMQVHSARILQERTEQLARAQTEAADSRIAVMVSQIQPHFIFNTLDTIYGLCDEDVELAKDAIASFSRYLRTNLSSLKRTTPVPISTEMEHVRTYLELERMSDEDRVHYEIDMQDTDFLVPALSVQTLVENAVKHGLGRMERGGTVIVRTQMLPAEHRVTIVDDGAGFDMDSVSDDGMHIGLANTRQRLDAMCGATLEVQSERGRGTTVVMHIPKQEDEA